MINKFIAPVVALFDQALVLCMLLPWFIGCTLESLLFVVYKRGRMYDSTNSHERLQCEVNYTVDFLGRESQIILPKMVSEKYFKLMRQTFVLKIQIKSS